MQAPSTERCAAVPRRRNIDGELQWLQSNSGAALGARFSAAVLAQLPGPSAQACPSVVSPSLHAHTSQALSPSAQLCGYALARRCHVESGARAALAVAGLAVGQGESAEPSGRPQPLQPGAEAAGGQATSCRVVRRLCRLASRNPAAACATAAAAAAAAPAAAAAAATAAAGLVAGGVRAARRRVGARDGAVHLADAQRIGSRQLRASGATDAAGVVGVIGEHGG
eukprot:scaffold78117_cov79-Phaeocystis_antarctica.AAC.1